MIYTDNLKNILQKVNSPISQFLLKVRDTDDKFNFDYLGIKNGTNDTISAIPQSKIKEVVEKNKDVVVYTGSDRKGLLTHNMSANGSIFNSLGYIPKGDQMSPPMGKGKVISQFTSLKTGSIFFRCEFGGKECVVNAKFLEIYKPKNEIKSIPTQDIKIGRIVRNILTTAKFTFTDKQLEDFVNIFKSEVDKSNDIFRNFEIVKGDDIKTYYKRKRYYHSSHGTLGNSCMASAPKKYFNLYSKNKNCSMVIMKTENSTTDAPFIMGRALLWNITLNDGTEVTMMDRIYTYRDSDVNLFKDFAKKNGWYCKYYNNTSEQLIVHDLEGRMVNLESAKVKLCKSEFDEYPYLDTFRFLSCDGNYLTNVESEGQYVLDDTEGERNEIDY